MSYWNDGRNLEKIASLGFVGKSGNLQTTKESWGIWWVGSE